MARSFCLEIWLKTVAPALELNIILDSSLPSGIANGNFLFSCHDWSILSGILQKIVFVFAWIMAKTMRLSGRKAYQQPVHIPGQTEAPLLVVLLSQE
jgi:hypothetical protein